MTSPHSQQTERFKFTWLEFSGSLGDLGLFIPLVVAMTVAADLNFGYVLIWAGVMNVFTGWVFRQPICVQPMKAIAVVVITEGLIKDEMVAAGLIMGLCLVLCSGIIHKINQWVPKAIVRGIQLGVGLKLVVQGIRWIVDLPVLGWDSIVLSIFIIVTLFVLRDTRKPYLVYLFLLGFLLLYLKDSTLMSNFHVAVPEFHYYWPELSSWKRGLVFGALPQLPLSILNSVIAVCALSADYFPGRGIQPKRMALSIGLMNLFCVPLGGIPMCHGAGGLAAQYRFGARTGGSVIMLGCVKIMIGLLLGTAILPLLKSYPMAILAPLLILAGLKLAQSAQDIVGQKKNFIIALVTALAILVMNTLVGFICGCVLAIVFSFVEHHKKR